MFHEGHKLLAFNFLTIYFQVNGHYLIIYLAKGSKQSYHSHTVFLSSKLRFKKVKLTV